MSTMSNDPAPRLPATDTRRFFPQLEGMRAIASIGVLTTHVAFQTRAVELPVIGPVLGRLDLAVALFFALSGFLLWRPWVAHAQARAPEPDVARYLRHRVVRIWPAYIVVVVAVLTLLPEAKTSDLTVWIANLTLTQVFVPLSLTAGLTQMWSLSVEVTFYALLPALGVAMIWFRRRDQHGSPGRSHWRIPVLTALGVLSLGWAWVGAALPLADGVEPKNWVFGHLPWFIAGLILAELTGAWELAGEGLAGHPRWMRVIIRFSARRWTMFAILVIAYALSCTPLAGPTGLGALTNLEFVTKMVLGGICGYAVLAPLVFNDGPFRFLNSPVMLALGRWSYGIFIWHLVILAVVFPLFGIVPFNGSTPLVWLITVGLTIGVSAASYAFIEEPARDWLRRREARRRRDAAMTAATDGPRTDQTSAETATNAGN